jgi:hypothetical protein
VRLRGGLYTETGEKILCRRSNLGRHVCSQTLYLANPDPIDKKMGYLIVHSETICSRRELTFATENRSESSTDGNKGKNDSDSDLTDTSELAQPLAERNCCEVFFFGMYSSIKSKFYLSLSHGMTVTHHAVFQPGLFSW